MNLCCYIYVFFFFFSSRRRHTRCSRDWSSDVCSSDLIGKLARSERAQAIVHVQNLRIRLGRRYQSFSDAPPGSHEVLQLANVRPGQVAIPSNSVPTPHLIPALRNFFSISRLASFENVNRREVQPN